VQSGEATGRRAAFVTGASYGLGAAIAVGLAQDGYDLAVSATRLENLAAVIAQIEAAGARAVPVLLDLRAAADSDRVATAVTNALGEIDLLVNNAAATVRKAAVEVTRDEWQTVMETNVTGTFFLTQAFGHRWIAQRRAASVVSLASTHGIVALQDCSVYGISKAAIIHMTKMLAIEWAPHGIRLNAVAPGTVETPLRAARLADPALRAAMLARVPLRRFAGVGEVAGAVRYLASAQAAYITGQTLVIDGGLTAY
jgi:NAD(P)-dependent dehydrogenase (short-subunit alcohol dehydrogenase family)